MQTKLQYSPRAYVEQFHLLFLDQLGRKLDKQLYALKGDCNLRFYFKSMRYSEDIDIDIKTMAKHTLHKNVNNIFQSIPFKQITQARGMMIHDITEPKQTETTQRWKLKIQLTQSNISLPTKIEFSRRGIHQSVKFEPIDRELIRTYQLPPILASHYTAQSAVSQKVVALSSRNETQARDVFDLYILLHRNINLALVKKANKKYLSKAIDNAMSLSYDDFSAQVLEYLPETYREQYQSPERWEDILISVVEALQ